jgi:aspartate oxidase
LRYEVGAAASACRRNGTASDGKHAAEPMSGFGSRAATVDDVAIVGGGVAGLFCALKLAPRPVTVVAARSRGAESAPAGGERGDFDGVRGPPERVADELADTAGHAARSPMLSGMLPEALACFEELRRWGVEDVAGIRASLLAAARRTPSIRIFEGYLAEQLRAEGDAVTGLVLQDRKGGLSDRALIPTRGVVLATGGVAGLYAPDGERRLRGDGLAMAARAGALVADADIVALAGGAGESRVGGRIVGRPSGGLHIDAGGRTTLDALWACGEAACAPAQSLVALPAGRLATSLVLAARVAYDIARQMPIGGDTQFGGRRIGELSASAPSDDEDIATLRETMTRHVGPNATRDGLRQALAMIGSLAAARRAPSMRNALAAAALIAATALKRAESRRTSPGPGQTGDAVAPHGRVFMTLRAAEAACGAALTNIESAAA